MRRGFKTTIGLAGCIALASGVRAAVNPASESRGYSVIAERNVFDLKPPTPPPSPAPAASAPSLNVKLTGITTILCNKRALFKVQETPAAGKAQKEESYILTEGQRQGVIEVLEIDERTGKVKIKNAGTVAVLTFEAVKLPNAPVVTATNPPGSNPPPLPNSAPQPANGQAAMPTRSPRGMAGQPEQPLSPEEQLLLVEAERARNRALIEEGKIPPPPTLNPAQNSQPFMSRNRRFTAPETPPGN